LLAAVAATAAVSASVHIDAVIDRLIYDRFLSIKANFGCEVLRDHSSVASQKKEAG
jgi:hypothetical protein